MKLVRWPVEPLAREERGLDERLVLRALEAGLPAPAFRESLPLGSKVRKTVLTRVCGGLTSRQEQWCVYWTRDGRVARQHIFTSENDALEALTDRDATTG